MENYNLTAELKKIASGISTSDPNTELGNINSNVGNLESAMNGVATAINNKTIPDPTTALGNIATTIGTKAIPDPNANIQEVASKLGTISGGKSLVDIDTILSSINNTLAQIGLNNVVNLTPTTGGFIMTFGGGGQTLVPNEAQFVDYTDTNNIGATDVQGAIDKLSNTSTWKYLGAVTGTTHMNYPASWQELWIQVVGQDTTWQNYDFTILKEFITNPNRPNASAFRNGFYVSNTDYGEATIVVRSTDVYINSLRVNGNDQTASSIMRVYYK